MNSPSPAMRPPSASAARRLTADPLWVLLPLRAFLAVVFLYAGLSKIADRRFLDSNDPTSMHQTTQAIKPGSPIGGLLGPVIDHSFAFGVLMACAELAVGIGIAFGLFTRIAAIGGLLITFSLFLTVSWQSNPWYTGADIVYIFALTPLILAGRTPLSVDDWLARTYARDDEQLPMRRAMLAGGATVLGLVALGVASLFRQKPASTGQPPSTGKVTASQSGSETTVSAGPGPGRRRAAGDQREHRAGGLGTPADRGRFHRIQRDVSAPGLPGAVPRVRPEGSAARATAHTSPRMARSPAAQPPATSAR
jgi:thiosulfate dehydrogenase [quinone] large subunit